MHPSERSGVNGIRGPVRGCTVKREKVCRGLTAGEMGGEWVKRGERVEGLKIWSDTEDVAGQALSSDEEWVS